MNGNIQLYTRVLRQFCEKQVHFSDLLTKFLDQEDYASAERHAHTVKGLLGTIGAQSQAQALATLENDLHARLATAHIAAQLAPITQGLNGLILAIESALTAQEAVARPAQQAVPVQGSADALTALMELLKESDPEAVDFAQSHALQIQSALGTDFAEIQQAIEDCAFDQALARLQVLVAKS